MSALRTARPLSVAIVVSLAACSGDIFAPDRPGDKPIGQVGSSDDPRGPQPPVVCPQPPRIWKLTPSQYTRSVQALLGIDDRPGDGLVSTVTFSTRGFTNEADVML